MASRNLMLLSAVAVVALFATTATADDTAAARAFTLKVLPVLKAKCYVCHGDGDMKPKGGLDVRSRAALLAGGDSGASLVPGKPADSLLYKAVKWDGLEMPPKENDRLTAAQIETIQAWISAARRGRPKRSRRRTSRPSGTSP